MIRSFRDKEAERIFRREVSRRLPTEIQQVALRKLRMIHHAQSLDDLRVPPANRLEKLGGDRAGTWSIRVNARWRICFRWEARKIVLHVSQVLIVEALDLERRHRMSFGDALIVHAAEASGALVLHSEDLSHGERCGAVEVVNPLAPRG